jgi:uncharacterized membrane protein YdjX (TVP38/TMEM64 family)
MKMEKRNIFKLIALCSILFIIFYFYAFWDIEKLYTATSIQSFFAEFRNLEGTFFFLLVYSIRPFFIVLPASPLALAAGAIWGKLLGLIIVVIGALCSGTVGFFFGRFFGKSFFDKITRGKIGKVKTKIEEGGCVSVVFFNFALLPWDFVSISSGVSKIKYKDFFLGILISSIPQSFIAVYLGHALLSIRSFADIFSIEMLIAVLLLIAGFIVAVVVRKYQKKP